MQVENKNFSHKRFSVISFVTSRNAFSFYYLFYMWGILTLFYYFGELADYAGWEALKWSFFYTVHDVHRLLFLIPILYAGYVFGVRAVIIITIITTATFLPRALFISPYPDPLARMLVFVIAAGIMGYLTAYARRESKRHKKTAALLTDERNKVRGILERMEDGVLVISPDYKVRYMNPTMVKYFGEGCGKHCYETLKNLNGPCEDICHLDDVIKGKIAKWEHEFPDGRSYEVVASPYRDTDGVICQLTIFKNLSREINTPIGVKNSAI